ncbi:unnamed protein product [Orchesella dallaii]|uniref:Uncharacterized protein n=1 Tax=Orchesella dallaii TaxID=48710 RepID=A0ABP1QV23_9HEXA
MEETAHQIRNETGDNLFVHFLMLFSTCTIHYCQDNLSLRSQSFDKLFDLSIQHKNILLLTVGPKSTFFVNDSKYNNWYKNNVYTSGRYKGKKYHRGYWEIFKTSKLVESCQLQVVDIKTNRIQLVNYLEKYLLKPSKKAIQIPDYLALLINTTIHNKRLTILYSSNNAAVDYDSVDQMRVFKTYSPLPIFCLVQGVVNFTPTILKVRSNLKFDKGYFYSGYVLPMHAIENLSLTSLFGVKKVRKKLFLLEQNGIIGLSINIGPCRILMSPRYNLTRKLENTFLNEAVDCLKAEFFYSNLSSVEFRKFHLDAGENHPDFVKAYYGLSYIFRYATSFHGFRYLVFVDFERTGKDWSPHTTALLRPFSIVVWILLIASIILISTALIRPKNPIFHILALFLEQGDASLNTKSYSIPILISVWLFASFILRFVYTSSMYSHLTVEPEMAIPRNLKDCVRDTKFYKLGSEYDVTEVFSRMRYEYDETMGNHVISNSTHPLLKRLSETIYLVQLLVEKIGFDYFFSTSPPYQIKLLHNHTNTLYAEQLCLDDKHRQNNNQKYEIINCRNNVVEANKFVYIYTFPFDEPNFEDGLDFFATILFGGKRVFGNNHPPMFNTLNGWAGAADFSTEIADDIVGKLEESGILIRWKTLEVILFLLKSWKRIQLNIFGARVSSMNLVQIAYDLIQDLNVPEYLYRIQLKGSYVYKDENAMPFLRI